MNTLKLPWRQFLIASMILLLCSGFAHYAVAASASQINRDSKSALASLYASNPTAKIVGSKAKAILIFPKIVKAGLVFGGSYGEGELLEGSRVTGYYNSASASWGLQAGAQTFGYAVFLMNKKAVDYLRNSKGWEFGAGPSVVLVNEGVAKNLSTTTLQDDAYAFIFSQQGLMLSLSLEGTKVSHIKR